MQCSQEDLAYLRGVVEGCSFNVIDPARSLHFESRLKAVLRSARMSTLGELVHSLRTRSNPQLERSIAEAMTINETSFFRDHRSFDLMRSELLPGLVTRRQSRRTLRLWSAACSSGQEAYSLAMMLLEDFPHLAGWKLSITGSDLSAAMVERARAGCYQRIEVNRGLPARFLLKYFIHTQEDWTVTPAIRSLCNFQQRNLCAFPWMAEKYDAVLLRNVLFYFSEETRHRLLARIHQMLEPDGFLFLGASEQAGLPSLWKPVIAGGACYHVPVQSSAIEA